MTNNEGKKASAIALTLLLCASLAVPVRAQPAEGQVKPDNTKMNKRDRTPGAATTDRRKMNAADRVLTTRIGRSIVANKSLPTYAHNRRNSMPPEARLQANASSSAVLPAQPDAVEIMKRSIAAADRSWKTGDSYTYIQREEELHMDSQGRLKSTDVNVSKAVFVNAGKIDQTVSHNGGPPTADQRRKDQKLLQERRSETPEKRAARLRTEKEDRAYLGEITEAFDFRLLGEQVIQGRPAYLLEAKPKAGYRARSKYGKMFSKVHGRFWVDKQDFGWVKVDASVIAPFSIGFFLATIQPGTHVVFEQTRVAEGIWLPKLIEIKAEAKILFVKNYQRCEVITYSEYHVPLPIQVAAVRAGSHSGGK